jgi:hypothetical protein
MAGDVYVTCSVSPCQIIHSIDLPPFQLDEAGGALIAAAVVAVWAVGLAGRLVIRALNVDRNQNSESDS